MKIAFLSMDPKGAPVRGAGYVAASIPSEHEVSFYCLMNSKTDSQYKELPEILVKENVDVIMVSTTTTLYLDACKFIRGVKKLKNICVLMGGVHPTVVGPELLKHNSDIDYLCIGEGESFVKDFVDNYGKDSLFKIDNLAYIKDEKLYSNPIRPPQDLSKLPKFPWHWFHRVVASGGVLSMTATRGCPYSCSYCCNTNFLKIYGKEYVRYRPVDDVIEELKYLKSKYKISRLTFGDEMIFSDFKYTKKLLELVKEKINIPYICLSRVEHINDEVIDLLKRTGCTGISMGIECGDEEFRRKHLNRFMSNDSIIKAFNLLKKAGIWTLSFNMIGFPFDYDDKLTKQTAILNKLINPNFVQVTWFYPFPGTKLYDYCVANDLIDKNNTLMSYHKGSSLKMHMNKKCSFKTHGKRK
jgi:anaerobic magnesium-protoporphyrin IX monomethyl ester cyclase